MHRRLRIVHRLPINPERFIERHGELMQVEFDALDPDDVRALFAGAMSDKWDTSAFEQVVQRERADRPAAAERPRRRVARHRGRQPVRPDAYHDDRARAPGRAGGDRVMWGEWAGGDTRRVPEDTYADILSDLRELYPPLPALRLKETHRRITHLAHGWYMRTHRGIDAVLLLREAGYAAESWPIRRSVLEHVVALKWLTAEGNAVAHVVRRRNASDAASRKRDTSRAGWRTASLQAFDEVIADATEESRELDEFRHFRQRCKKYGSPDELASYMIETAHSHPDWDTASMYLDEPDTALPEPKPVDRDDEGWCAMRLWDALDSLNQMMEAPAWTDALEAMLIRMQTLTA